MHGLALQVTLRAYGASLDDRKGGKPFVLRLALSRHVSECDANLIQTLIEIQMKTELMKLRELIANDATAISYQSLGQYRTMLLNFIDSEPQIEARSVSENEVKKEFFNSQKPLDKDLLEAMDSMQMCKEPTKKRF